MISNAEVDAMFDASIPAGNVRCPAPGLWFGAMRDSHAKKLPISHTAPITWCPVCHGIGYIPKETPMSTEVQTEHVDVRVNYLANGVMHDAVVTLKPEGPTEDDLDRYLAKAHDIDWCDVVVLTVSRTVHL